jgi:hypothetical protein
LHTGAGLPIPVYYNHSLGQLGPPYRVESVCHRQPIDGNDRRSHWLWGLYRVQDYVVVVNFETFKKTKAKIPKEIIVPETPSKNSPI